ncbi:MAG: class II aldolase/adducin family protein, partial [Desulfovibrionaceae bacterium]
VAHLDAALPVCSAPPGLAAGPFADEAAARAALAEAGRATVARRLVDSSFGNISCRLGSRVLISRSGGFLDDLAGKLDACDLGPDGRPASSAALTASSELPAHLAVYALPDATASGAAPACILHGHPPFCVIRSLVCEEPDAAGCPVGRAGECHLRCPRPRRAGGAPVVPGEVGAGPRGLGRTMPPALRGEAGVIVHGHGLFAADPTDFNGALAALQAIENRCRASYLAAMAEARARRAGAAPTGID